MRPERNEEVGSLEFASGETPTAWVYANQKPVIVHDWTRDTHYPRLRDFLLKFDIHSSCMLPLTTVHRRIGVFAIGVSRPEAYSDEEVAFLSLVSDHLALAIDSAPNLEASHKAQAELAGKNERLELVLDLTNRVVSNLELKDLLREVAASVRPGYDKRDALKDISLVFPIERLRELAAEKVIGRLADNHYGFGLMSSAKALIPSTREVARRIREAGVDLVLLVPA